ncbi:hypothetical protein H3S83_10995 [Bartonella sp. W8122]|uniref:hypothetical protein n=1 Tax=Bartonella sp. W8122 TaxID=2750930 RepID=UPI0018DCAB3B|nr:hypothetical protein [Bartonella sp. W8122]MBI0002349.1 hypothetical protein [Bartonella sp. W8122]
MTSRTDTIKALLHHGLEVNQKVTGQYAVGSKSPATTNNNTAMAGFASITQDKRTI